MREISFFPFSFFCVSYTGITMIIRFSQVIISIQAIISEIYYVSNHWNFLRPLKVTVIVSPRTYFVDSPRTPCVAYTDSYAHSASRHLSLLDAAISCSVFIVKPE